MELTKTQLEARRLYLDDELTIAAIAGAMKCSKEAVRQQLSKAGVDRRARKSAPVSKLAREVMGDLREHFGGRATVSEMTAWLGDPREDVQAALDELDCFNRVRFDGEAYVLKGRVNG